MSRDWRKFVAKLSFQRFSGVLNVVNYRICHKLFDLTFQPDSFRPSQSAFFSRIDDKSRTKFCIKKQCTEWVRKNDNFEVFFMFFQQVIIIHVIVFSLSAKVEILDLFMYKMLWCKNFKKVKKKKHFIKI